MDFADTLRRAKTLHNQGHFGQAVQTAASALETAMIEVYSDLIVKSTPTRQQELSEAIQNTGKGKALSQLGLGQLLGVYNSSHADKDLHNVLGYDIQFFAPASLSILVNIRNKTTHHGYAPSSTESQLVLTQTELVLREFHRLPAEDTRTSGAAAIRSWWEVATPTQDIREGRLDLKLFAVDLAQVIEGSAAPEYRDPDLFFRRTYMTNGLRETARGVLRRLAGQEDGTAITQMATVFGGGKTHTLLALYHLVANATRIADHPAIQQVLRDADLETIPQARIATVDCAQIGVGTARTTPEGVDIHTLWGEIAYRLGGVALYEHIRDSDERLVAPGSGALEALLAAAGPSLILLDETLSYITKSAAITVGGGFLSDQAHEFLLELTRAVSASDNAALVVTVTASEEEQYGEKAVLAARALGQTIRVLHRSRQVEVTVEREEIYEILKRRLFDADPVQMEAQARAVAQAYWDYYRQYPSDFPQDAQAPEYRDLMVQAYPFHPALIEVLRDRWGTIGNFQRTRGVLRLLALVIADLYRRREATPLIQPAHINLDSGEIRNELLTYVDQRGGYESAMLSDIGGSPESKAPYLDRTAGSDYQRFNIATGLATAIFMYSHSGATERVATAERTDLWLMTLRPGIIPALAAEALDRLTRNLFYLAVQEGSYRIDSQPNLNQMLVQRIEGLRQDRERVRAEMQRAVEEIAGRRIFPELVIWPTEPAEIPDRRTLTLVVLDPSHTWRDDERSAGAANSARAFIERTLETARNAFRQYKNTLVFVAPTQDGARLLEDSAVKFLALESIHRQHRDKGLSESQMHELQAELERSRKGLADLVWSAYTVLIAPTGSTGAGGNGTRLWVRLESAPAYRPLEHTLSGRAWKRMLDEQRLLGRIDPRLVSEGKGDQWVVWPTADDRINVGALWDRFCRYPYLPMLANPDGLHQTIAWGVDRGLFAYALGDGTTFDTIYYRQVGIPGDLGYLESAWLLRPALATELLLHRGTTAPPEVPTTTTGPVEVAPNIKRIAEHPNQPTLPLPSYRLVSIDTAVDWREWYDFYQSVIQPLVESGALVSVTVQVNARGDIDANLVDLSVKENVMQRNPGAKVEVE